MAKHPASPMMGTRRYGAAAAGTGIHPTFHRPMVEAVWDDHRSTAPRRCRYDAANQHSKAQTKPTVQPASISVG
jgi:hypothetical protein